MFKLFLFAAMMAFAAAAPGNIAFSTPLVAASPYASTYFAASPFAYNGYQYSAYPSYASAYGLPYAYAAKPAYLI